MVDAGGWLFLSQIEGVREAQVGVGERPTCPPRRFKIPLRLQWLSGPL
jgi:hypothetical protein